MSPVIIFILYISLIRCQETPRFFWSSKTRSSKTIPNIGVIFSNGENDTIEFMPYSPLDPEIMPKNEEVFTFMGRLISDPSSVVALTGSSRDSDYHITILRATHDDITVRVNESGHSFHIQGIRRGSSFVDDSLLLNLKPHHRESLMSDRAMPKFNYLRLICGYTPSAIAHFGSVNKFRIWLSQLMTHLQAYYNHPSLNFSITFDVPFPVVDLTSLTKISDASDLSLNKMYPLTTSILANNDNGQHLAVFVKDSSVNSMDIAGIAPNYGICSQTYLAVSITEIQSSVIVSAKITAHEMAHNMGVEHDDPQKGLCSGIMSPAITGGNVWSTCSNADFHDYQMIMSIIMGNWCLDRANPAKIGGSWTPWSLYTTCSKPCGTGVQARSRVCVGKNCVGASTELNPCNTQPCLKCKDLDSQCASKKLQGWCGNQVKYMKINCKATCNVDSKSSNYCQLFRSLNICQIPGLQNLMAKNCGATCAIFCP